MTEKEKKFIQATVAETVRQLKAEGLLEDAAPRRKTEELLREYPSMDALDERRMLIGIFLTENENDPYIDAIRLYYFAGNKSTATASIMCSTERTCRRNRLRLVDLLAAKLVAAGVIK